MTTTESPDLATVPGARAMRRPCDPQLTFRDGTVICGIRELPVAR
ncbi:hypothetical protein ACIBQ1_60440 [Nonomuraea sp. NPDC050153]